MILILSIFLVFSIISKLFPPKKPNYLFGYQLGNAKKSLEHWKIANKYASQYMIILYSFLLILSIIFNYTQYDGGILILFFSIIGFLFIFISIEKKLKNIN